MDIPSGIAFGFSFTRLYIFAAMSTKDTKTKIHLFESWTFTRINYIIFGVGIVIIITGYVIMATGDVNSFQSLTIAPIMLFFGYLVIIPVSLIYRDKSERSIGESEKPDTPDLKNSEV